MIFRAMPSDLEKEECADYLRLRCDYLKEVKRLMNELDLWKLSVHSYVLTAHRLGRIIVGMDFNIPDGP